MTATFTWQEENGTAGSSTISTPTDTNWKNADDTSATAYNAAPITAGNNSFEKWIYGKFSGTFNKIQNGFWAHTATAFGAGLTLKGEPSMTASANALAYATPATAANANLTVNMTAVTAIASGQVVWFAPAQPDTNPTFTASQTTNPCFTNFLTTQLQTTAGAAAGDTATVTMTLQYDEN